jgi:hypothetical protein
MFYVLLEQLPFQEIAKGAGRSIASGPFESHHQADAAD